MKIGVLNYRFDFYTYTRTIVNILPEAEYVKVQDVYSILNRLARKANRTLGKTLFSTFDLNNQYQDFGRSGVDVLHFMNGVSYGSIPWVTSFETIVPRLASLMTRHQGAEALAAAADAKTRRAFEALTGARCKRLLPWSANSAAMQRDLLDEFPQYRQAILPKITVLHPPQALQLQSYDEKPLDSGGKVRFVLVGAAFFRKGGREILAAFERMVRQYHYPIELVIVSSMRIEDYAARETEADVARARAMITENRDWVTHYEQLPNNEVLSLMKNAQVGLLPTYADTYGLSVLELQACGCPVISSDVRALPEINDNDAGWLIEVPKNRFGEGLYTTPAEREALSAALVQGLEAAVHEIFADPDTIRRKGEAALRKVAAEHDPHAYAEALRAVYREALQSE